MRISVALVVVVLFALMPPSACKAEDEGLVFGVHNVEVSQSREGWISVDVAVSVSNKGTSLIRVPEDLGSLSASWHEYSYEGHLDVSSFEWVPPGYSFLVYGSIGVPEVAYPEISLFLD